MVESIARLRHIRITPQKARRVVDLIRGKQATEALAILKFAPQAAATPVYKLVASAMANARVKADAASTYLDEQDLFVAERVRRRGHDPQAVPAASAGPRVPDQQAHEPHHGRARDARRGPTAPVAAAEEGEEPLMGQKVNPYGFRLGITTDHVSRWFSDSHEARSAVQRLRRRGRQDPAAAAEDVLDRAGVARIEIERTRDRVRVDIHTARPGHRDRSPRRRGRAHPRRPREAHEEADPAEHPRGEEPRGRGPAGRAGHRRAALRPRGLPPRDAQGPAGRPARRRQGRPHPGLRPPRRRGDEPLASSTARAACPLHTLRANIDYGFYEAKTTFGRIGVKVWIYKGDITEQGARSRAGDAEVAPPRAPRRPRDGGRRRPRARADAPLAEERSVTMLIPRGSSTASSTTPAVAARRPVARRCRSASSASRP